MMKTRLVSLILAAALTAGLVAVPVLADEGNVDEIPVVSEEAVLSETGEEISEEAPEAAEAGDVSLGENELTAIPDDGEEGQIEISESAVPAAEEIPEGEEAPVIYEAELTEDMDDAGEAEVLNGATSIAGAVVGEMKSAYRVENVNGTYYVNGKQQSSTTDFVFSFTYTLKLGSTYLQKDRDFTVSGKLNGFVGTGQIIFTGKGNYTGTKTHTFRWINTTSIFGGDRYSSAVRIARDKYTSSSNFSEVVLVKGSDFPDALSANAYAGLGNSPLLLTRPNELPADVKTFLTTYKSKIKVVTFIGGGLEGAQDQVRSEFPGVTVQEIAGAERKETAELVCQRILQIKGTAAKNGTVFVATGYNPADALAASPWSYLYEYPILLTNSKGQATEETKALIKQFKTVILLGQEAQVSSSVVSHVTPIRLYGADRYATSRKIVSNFLGGYKNLISENNVAWVTIASGLNANYPDALAGGQLMQPIILVNDSHASIPSDVKSLRPSSTAGKSVMYDFLGAAGRGKGTMYEKVCAGL